MISSLCSIHRVENVYYTTINEDEIVVLDPESENFYHFNTTAVDLWLALESPKTILELSQIIADKYLGEAKNYIEDILEWIDDSVKKGLLTAKNQNTT